jgi:integrase
MARKTVKARRGRHEGSVYLRADGRWTAVISLGIGADGKRDRKQVYGETKAAVLTKIDDERRKALLRAPREMESERVTMEEYLTVWLEEIVKPTIRARTYQSYKGAIDRHISPRIGTTRLGKLKPITLQRFYSQLEREKVGARTRQLVHVTLATALKRAVRLNLIETNPVDGVDAPRVPKAQTTALTFEEMEKLLDALRDHRLLALFITGFTTGMRPGEILGLQWQDINFDEATIAVRRTIEDHAGKSVVGEPKTAGSRRRIDIPARCVRALKQHKEKMFHEGLRACAWVFPSTTGTPLGIRNVSRLFKEKLEAAGLPLTVRLYDMRHTAATLALVAGVPLKVVSERLGHSSIKITADTYQHVTPSLQRDALTKLDKLFGS